MFIIYTILIKFMLLIIWAFLNVILIAASYLYFSSSYPLTIEIIRFLVIYDSLIIKYHHHHRHHHHHPQLIINRRVKRMICINKAILDEENDSDMQEATTYQYMIYYTWHNESIINIAVRGKKKLEMPSVYK